MYFKKLEIFGFKSFADKTILNFEPGITAVVGPNGCGKSNIFDAIRWALGEQSVKELRGSAMEDVIFNGTDKKPSLGFAEVNITFSNESRMLPIEYDEVTITRRLFRSGESEYLLNKQVARLKDIQELLMGTGIGAEAYSLVQQGKIDLVVSAKPEDRRIIIDEASGITKYKSKKREALNKLKDTENNLIRVNDITIEVKRQIGSIERQANKARKYKEEYEKLKDLEVAIAKFDIDALTERKNTFAQQLNQYQQKEGELTQTIDQLNETLTGQINYLSETEQKINEVHSNEIKLDGEIDLNNRQIGFNQERIENLNQNNQRLLEQKEQLIARCKTQQEKIEQFKQSIEQLKEALIKKEGSLKENRSSLTHLEQSIRGTKDRIREDEEKILGLTSKQVSVRNDLTDVMKELQGALARKRRLEMENDKVSLERDEIGHRLSNTDFQIRSIQGTIIELENERKAKKEILQELEAQLKSVTEKVDSLEKKKLFLKSQKEFIEKMHTQYQDMPDPVVEGRLFTQGPPLDHHTGIIGKVKEIRKIDDTQKDSLTHSFGKESGQHLYEIICETKFIELDPQQIGIKIQEIEREIHVLEQEQEEFSTKINSQREVLDRLDDDIINKEKSLSILVAQRKDITEEVNKLNGELELVETELSEVKESIATIKKSEDELNYELDTIGQDISWSQNQIKENQEKIADESARKEDVTVSIAQLQTELESGKGKLNSDEDNFRSFNEALDSWLEEIKKIDDEVESSQSKKEGFLKEIERLKLHIEDIKGKREGLKSSLVEHEAQKEEIGRRINQFRSKVSHLEEEIDQIKQKLHDQQMQVQEISFSIKGIKDRLQQTYKIDYDETLRKMESEALSVQSEEQEPKRDKENEDNKTQQDNDQPAVKVQSEEEETVPIEEQKEKLEKLKKRCESYGNVNLVAIEEYEELKERFEFLTKQQSDLLEAKSKLMSTITKINRSTRQMFMDTFTKVSEEFRIYYRMLFGGGEAQLVLLDPENVLESGIDIVARPPGKKLQNISLLSGGEKSLTAIALIFGVFKVNPSPFCVLDEIDAALDESNVGRFSYLLQDFAKIAQFIVITHNKKTISASNIMYGITMPETGVSKIVSVKMADEDKQKANEEVPAGV